MFEKWLEYYLNLYGKEMIVKGKTIIFGEEDKIVWESKLNSEMIRELKKYFNFENGDYLYTYVEYYLDEDTTLYDCQFKINDKTFIVSNQVYTENLIKKIILSVGMDEKDGMPTYDSVDIVKIENEYTESELLVIYKTHELFNNLLPKLSSFRLKRLLYEYEINDVDSYVMNRIKEKLKNIEKNEITY